MYQNELYHYGVKGMHWGVRKTYSTRQSINTRGSAISAKDEAKSAHKLAKKYTNAMDKLAASSHKQAERYTNAMDRKAAKRQAQADVYFKAESAKKSITKKAVKDYQKSMNEANNMAEAADAKWAEVKQKRMATGKNAVSRFMASVKNESKEAKAYNKAFEEASKMSDAAYVKEMEAKTKYQQTGKNAVSRIINNMKYA